MWYKLQLRVYSETSRTEWEKPGTISGGFTPEMVFVHYLYIYIYRGRTPQLAPLHLVKELLGILKFLKVNT